MNAMEEMKSNLNQDSQSTQSTRSSQPSGDNQQTQPGQSDGIAQKTSLYPPEDPILCAFDSTENNHSILEQLSIRQQSVLIKTHDAILDALDRYADDTEDAYTLTKFRTAERRMIEEVRALIDERDRTIAMMCSAAAGDLADATEILLHGARIMTRHQESAEPDLPNPKDPEDVGF